MTGGIETLDLLVKIGAAVVLGGLIGWQREMAHKPAGLRTHILIVLGATVVMEVSRYASASVGGDPTRIAANIIVGIGFIGAGTIMREGPTVHGLTSAATIWVDGALGTAIGCGYYFASVLLTLATVLVLGTFGGVESLARKKCILRRYEVHAGDSEQVFARIRRSLEISHLPHEMIDLARRDKGVSLEFTLCDSQERHERLLADLRTMGEVERVRSL